MLVYQRVGSLKIPLYRFHRFAWLICGDSTRLTQYFVANTSKSSIGLEATMNTSINQPGISGFLSDFEKIEKKFWGSLHMKLSSPVYCLAGDS